MRRDDDYQVYETTDGRTHFHETKVYKTVKKGLSFGSCLAMILSYTAWKSIPWAIFHGLLSWVYVIYYAIRY